MAEVLHAGMRQNGKALDIFLIRSFVLTLEKVFFFGSLIFFSIKKGVPFFSKKANFPAFIVISRISE